MTRFKMRQRVGDTSEGRNKTMVGVLTGELQHPQRHEGTDDGLTLLDIRQSVSSVSLH